MVKKQSPEMILGIESSCDDTCAALVSKGNTVLSSVRSSQDEIHAKFGGVVPELAARKHIENIPKVITLALQRAEIGWEKVEGIAVSNRYGLASSLLVGVAIAKALAYAQNLPLVGVNHVEGHMYSNFLEHRIEFPYISLTVAGGHTLLILVKKAFSYQVLGQSTDDAVGEAYDKVARYLGLGYPGGPIIDRLAVENQELAVHFTSPMLKSGDYNFSFSGIKTAVRYYVDKLSQSEKQKRLSAIAAGFQAAVVRVLVAKAIKASREYRAKAIALSGGVAANSKIRSTLDQATEKEGIACYYPSLRYCTDNGAMIAGLGYWKFLQGEYSDFSLEVHPEPILQ